MSKDEFLRLMEFPKEWSDLNMYPADEGFFRGQLDAYEPGDENSSEHFRNAAYFWWLQRRPSKDILDKLVALSHTEDPVFGAWLRDEISKVSGQ